MYKRQNVESFSPEVANISIIFAAANIPSRVLLNKGNITPPHDPSPPKIKLVLEIFSFINVGICPTPVLIYFKNKLKIPAGMIITGSHNPPEWNGIKLLSSNNYLNNEDLKEIRELMEDPDLSLYPKMKSVRNVETLNPIPEY